MRMTVTDRTGLDNTPLTIYLLKSEWDARPTLGTTVCALGPDDWRYIGPVISIDTAAHAYTIRPVAANKRQDNFKVWHEATE